jgi:hypothetical protein
MSPADNQGESNGQLIPQEVAELAGQLSEAEDESRRRRLARQIANLAGRTGHVTKRSVRAGRSAAPRGVQSGTGAVVRRVQSTAAPVTQRVRPARDAAARRLKSGQIATRRGTRAGGSATLRRVRASSQWLTARALEMAPKVPIRSNAKLRQQYPGLQTEQLADRLIAGAARASAGVGAAVGATAAVPFIPTAPLELGVETLALVAIELKLIAELHEVYEMPAPGSAAQRMAAYTGAWAERRGVRVTSSGLALAVGSPLRRKLERRLLAKAGKSALALTPLLTGAVAGALIDHHETRKLGTLIRDDLRNRGQS